MNEQDMKMAEKIYSEIPMRTWRWLGVNEARVADAVLAQDIDDVQSLSVAAGESRELTVVYRQEGQGRIDVKVAEGGSLKLTVVQLLPTDKRHASQGCPAGSCGGGSRGSQVCQQDGGIVAGG